MRVSCMQILRIFNLREGLSSKIFPDKIGFYKINFNFALRYKRKILVPWCNGSTTDFGSVSLGSNPGGTTKNPALNRVF